MTTQKFIPGRYLADLTDDIGSAITQFHQSLVTFKQETTLFFKPTVLQQRRVPRARVFMGRIIAAMATLDDVLQLGRIDDAYSRHTNLLQYYASHSLTKERHVATLKSTRTRLIKYFGRIEEVADEFHAILKAWNHRETDTIATETLLLDIQVLDKMAEASTSLHNLMNTSLLVIARTQASRRKRVATVLSSPTTRRHQSSSQGHRLIASMKHMPSAH